MRKMKEYETSTKDYVPSRLFHGYRINFKEGKVINDDNLLLGSLQKNGYVKLAVGGELFYMHRLIWIEAHENEQIQKDYEIDHINNIRSDNRLENLQKITRRENLLKSAKNRDYSYVANNHKNKKCVLETCLDTGKKRLFGSLFQVTKRRGINQGIVSLICQGICHKSKSKVNNKTYTYKYITKEKYEKLKSKYKCYERKKMTSEEFQERSKVYRANYKAKHSSSNG